MIKIDKIKRLYYESKTTFILLAFMLAYFIFLTLNGGSTDSYVLLEYGAFYPPIIVAYGEYYRFVTSIFMHIGLSHILFNSYALYIFGPQIEKIMGWKKYLAFFLLTGIGGNLLTFIFSFDSLSAGASGGLYGILGAFLYLIRHHGDRINPVWKSYITRLVGINLVLTIVVPSISVTAHLGGLVLGYLLSFVFIG